jgi:pimeloyl-ACP methyl ester carboxylesterase
MKVVRVGARVVSPVAYAASIPGPTRLLLFGLFFARPNRLPREEAAYALRVYARAPSFPDAADWLFANRAEGLAEIECPVTIAWGTRDLLLFPRQARHFLAQLPGARLEPLDRLGHTPMSDDPERVAAVILGQTTAAPSAQPAATGPSPAPAL